MAIIVTDDFEQIEMVDPRKFIVAAGADTTLIAPNPGQVQGMKHDEKADRFDVEMLLAEADPEEFDALLLPGRALNSDHLRVEKKAQQFVRSFDRAGKPMAVICHAPWLLVSSGIVKGRTLTSYHTIQDDIRNAGGTWIDRPAVRDRNPRDEPQVGGPRRVRRCDGRPVPRVDARRREGGRARGSLACSRDEVPPGRQRSRP